MLKKKLNVEQQKAFQIILECVNKGKCGMLLYRALLAHLRSIKKITIATTTSGVAAAIMSGGRTSDSRFKIPIDPNESTECNISKQSGVAELLRRTTSIIWDIMGNNEDIGGKKKVNVFGGDFRQVLPVVPRGTIFQTVSASLVKSFLWNKMKKISLSTHKDPNFSEFLLRVGNGDEPVDVEDHIKIPEQMIINLSQNAESFAYMTTRDILAAKNEDVDKLNEKLIYIFPGEERTFRSFDEAVDHTNNSYEEEFLNSLTPNGLPPHKLPSNGLCNGIQMVCKKFKDNVIDVEIVFGQHVEKHAFIPRIPLSYAENEGYPFKFKGMYFPQSIFSHGQLYVALSRGTSSATTKVLIKPDASNVRHRMLTKKYCLQRSPKCRY
ncbi:hypothetical protein ABFS83_07G081200 [Erythranthe nasuta]